MSPENLIQLSDARAIGGLNAPATTARAAAAEVKKADDIDAPGPICVIDDDEWVCNSITTLLETYGFNVLSYTSAAQFLGDRRRDGMRCLVIDQHMPDMEGLDAVAVLHREELFPPIILITGRLNAAITRRAGELGVHAILEKPFPVARLVTLIRTALDLHE